MRQVLLKLVGLAILTGANALAQEKADEAVLIKLDKEWVAAESKGDVTALERILADDYSYVDSVGRKGNKRQHLTALKGGTRAEASGHGEVTTDDYNVNFYGNTAVMTHRVLEKGDHHGQPFADQKQSLHVWVKRGDRWQVVSHQWTPVLFPNMPQEPFLNLKCARNSFQPEVLAYFGDSDAIIAKLENDQMGLPDRRGYFLLIETTDTAEIVMFERRDEQNVKVSEWQGASFGNLRERLTDLIVANRGIACIGEQSKALVRVSYATSDRGTIPTPVSARAAFSHYLRKYGPQYLRVTMFLLC